MTAKPSDDEVLDSLARNLNQGEEKAAEDKAAQRAAKAVADAAKKPKK